MPTISPDPAPPAVPELHKARAVAESFGADAARYDRARPPYPAELIARIRSTAPGGEFLDVGTGTGIAARQFVAAGCAVLGVEPDARMAEFARRTGIHTEVSMFEDWDPKGRTFDAVVAGTAWHWVDPVAGAAQAARVLRAGGLLAPFHHVFQAPPELHERTRAVYRRVLPSSPFSEQSDRSVVDAYQVIFDKIADGIRTSGRFTDPDQWRFDWERTYTRDEWLDHLPTTGGMSRLEPDQLAELQSGIGAAIDALGGAFTMSYATVAVTATRR